MKNACTFGSGAPGTLDEMRRRWRETDSHAALGKTLSKANGERERVKRVGQQTASLKGGLTVSTKTNPYRNAGEESDGVSTSGTSIFDPVLCEIVYRWFCPVAGLVLDPFAGGSVRGIVATKLGYQYTGIDLRPEQVAANQEQATAIVPENPPSWLVGDARNVAALAPGQYDLIFSCPPYGDLERYSDDPADLSTLDHPAFLDAYRGIVAASVGMLRSDRFAVFVVGDIRDKRGFYRNFVADTIAAFQDAGARLYNEAVLITMVGSLLIRVGSQFGRYRKLGKTHQNVLVFFNGDPGHIPQELGEVEASDPASGFGEVEE